MKKIHFVILAELIIMFGCMFLWCFLRKQTVDNERKCLVQLPQSPLDARRLKPQIVEASAGQHVRADRAENRQTELRLMAEMLYGDFTLENAQKYVEEAERFVLSSKKRNHGSDYLNATIGLVTLRLGRIERSESKTDEFVLEACKDLEVIGHLIERAWRIGNDPAFGENWTAMDGHELARIRYERREAAAWREKGVEGIARAHEKLAKKLEMLMESDDGPLRVTFDRYCCHVDAMATRLHHPLNERERWEAKKELLDTIKKFLGRYPGWGELWLNNSIR